jgi:hypothetical protein
MYWLEELTRKHIDWLLWLFYGYGKRPLYPLGWSVGTILFFGIFWSITGQRMREVISDEYSWDQNSSEYHKKSLLDNIDSVLKPFTFSTTIFLSGTKLFVDPPKVPEIPRLPESLINSMFALERVLGAFFSILFFLAVGATIVR